MTPIRERSTAALAEALATVQPPDPDWVASIAGDGIPGANWEGWAKAMLSTTPTLARRLDFATAWDDAEAELPEETTLSLGASAGSWVASYQHVHTACERCGVLHQCEDSGWVKGWGATPIDALVALTEALRERA